MEAEGMLGAKLVFTDGVLEVFSHGLSRMRISTDEPPRVNRMPRKDGFAVTLTVGNEGVMLAFNGEQAPAAEAVLNAYLEAAGQA